MSEVILQRLWTQNEQRMEVKPIFDFYRLIISLQINLCPYENWYLQSSHLCVGSAAPPKNLSSALLRPFFPPLSSLTRLAAAVVLAKYFFSPKSERIYIRSPMWHSMEYQHAVCDLHSKGLCISWLGQKDPAFTRSSDATLISP